MNKHVRMFERARWLKKNPQKPWALEIITKIWEAKLIKTTNSN